MTKNNADRIAWDNAWREAAERGECTAEECDCNTYDHDGETTWDSDGPEQGSVAA